MELDFYRSKSKKEIASGRHLCPCYVPLSVKNGPASSTIFSVSRPEAAWTSLREGCFFFCPTLSGFNITYGRSGRPQSRQPEVLREGCLELLSSQRGSCRDILVLPQSTAKLSNSALKPSLSASCGLRFWQDSKAPGSCLAWRRSV